MKRNPATIGHLAGRFFGHLGATPPGPADQQYVHDHLTPPCAAAFWTQSPADQEHAVTVARRVEAEIGDDPATIEAALLHDIGKRDVRIGAIGRSIATVLDAAGLPMTRRMRAYRDHGPAGGRILESAGCGRLAVAFAGAHPAGPPADVDAARWQVLLGADG